MQFMKENLQRITEGLDTITVELQEIKCQVQVSNKDKHLEKLQKDTEIVRDSIQRLEPQTDVTLQTLNDCWNDTDTEIKSVHQQADPIEYQVKEKNIQFWNQRLMFRRIAFWNMVKNTEKSKIYQSWLTSYLEIFKFRK